MAKQPHSPDPGQDGSGNSDLRALADRISRAQQSRQAIQAASDKQHGDMTGMGRALRFVAEFMAAIIVGGVLGYALDAALGTRPWAMIVLLMIGFAAGVLNVMRAAAQQNAAAAAAGTPGTAPVDDEDDDA